MAGIVAHKEAHVSRDMGMHTEGLRGRTQQRFFDITEENVGFGYPDAPDVDFNKRAEIDCEGRDTKEINGNLRSIEEVMRTLEGGTRMPRSAATIPTKLFVGSLSDSTTSAVFDLLVSMQSGSHCVPHDSHATFCAKTFLSLPASNVMSHRSVVYWSKVAPRERASTSTGNVAIFALTG